ncbi:MAG: ATP-binding protein [Methylococcales bacterium]|nr:ATP-binding protein [Methylococcales bacterium]
MSLSFQSRIVLFFSTLFIVVQILTLLAIYWVCRANIIEQIGQNLIYAENIFNRQLTEHGDRMAGEARILVADYGFRAAISDSDQATQMSALENLIYRIHAQTGFYINLQGRIIADSSGRFQEQMFRFPDAIAKADAQGQAVMFGLLDGELCELVVAPVLAPLTIGWVGIVIPVDHGLVDSFKHLSAMPPDISLLAGSGDSLKILASSLADPSATFFKSGIFQQPVSAFRRPKLVESAAGSLLVLIRPLAAANAGQAISAVFEVNLTQALKPYAILGYVVLGLSIFGLLAILSGAYLLARNIAQPVRALASVSQRIKAGIFGPPLPVSDDELGRLAETFNMASRIAGEMSELKAQDRQRRELVASVSHDLRTPLTSLHGYLETMQLQAGQIADADRQRYLDIAVRQSEKVGRLAQELFELAKLECRATPLQLENFNILELVQDVTQKYGMAAKTRGVDLHAGLDTPLPLVNADIALIERVLTNLIDNALRHTPPGGSVLIELQALAGRIRIAVIDNGEGIAPQFLAKLFDRDSPLSRQAGGGGLGLQIAARIVAMHGGVIQAQSSPGVKTLFSFDLAAAS